MLLENKAAVIYGGGGKAGGAVARAFAREGARVSLAARTLESLEEVEVAEEIRSAGGVAESAQPSGRRLMLAINITCGRVAH